MRDAFKRPAVRVFAVLAAALVGSAVAVGMPWDIDMADSQAVKAYEREMFPLPAGVIPQDNALTPTTHVAPVALGSAEMNALTNPLPPDAEVLATGKRMYDVYCTPCHGDGVVLGKVAQNYPGIAVLAGDAPTARLRAIPDGRLYVTIRHGYGLMPAYGSSMDETEIWSLVHYARTLPNAVHTPVPPAAPPAAPQEAPQ